MISIIKWLFGDDYFGKEPEWAITDEEISEQLHLDSEQFENLEDSAVGLLRHH
jgi:hypothetical protein